MLAFCNKPATFPVQTQDVIYFASHLFDSGFAHASIASYIAAVSFINQSYGGRNLLAEFLIKKTLVGIQRASLPAVPREPITLDLLNDLLAALTRISINVHDCALFQAMFSAAFHCFLRVGEFTVIDLSKAHAFIPLDDLILAPGASFTITLRHYKGNTGRAPFYIRVAADPNAGPFCPVSIMTKYLRFRGPGAGPLFRSLGSLSPVTRSSFSRMLAAALKAVGRSGAHIKPHSFRIGAATTACAMASPTT